MKLIRKYPTFTKPKNLNIYNLYINYEYYPISYISVIIRKKIIKKSTDRNFYKRKIINLFRSYLTIPAKIIVIMNTSYINDHDIVSAIKFIK